MSTKSPDRPLTQLEAQMVTDWLRLTGKVIRHWRSVFQLARPEAIAKKFSVSKENVLKFARRLTETEES